MKSRRLAVGGVVEFSPEVFADDRGLFVSPLENTQFREVTGAAWFPTAQVSLSRSRRGVVRGVHYTATPPGVAKYVYCPHGRVLDICVDIRVGSPTFGVWDTVLLDHDDFRAVYLPIGVGHAFVALEDDSCVAYALSGGYVPENEMGLNPLDPALGLPIPTDIDPVLSDRDRAAPTLAQALKRGLLPEYSTCQKVEDELWPVAGRKE